MIFVWEDNFLVKIDLPSDQGETKFSKHKVYNSVDKIKVSIPKVNTNIDGQKD
jgi:hypothetical protein